MITEHKKLIEDLFLTAADLSPDQREAYLQCACPDPETAREVSSLLAYDTNGAATLDRVVRRAAASLIGGDPLLGTRLGPYRITEELGRGGMGAVFLAIRDDRTFEKKVAVKVVKRGMDSDAVLDRFRHERRILANLDHPYICRLLDAGTTPDGRPYFVMEYVEGQPIVAYCAEHQLNLTATLELFRKVCDAVSCAHRNLIVHRDLKAGNILVAADGSPKLLDFGIAKLLDPAIRTQETEAATRMLTLDCASPEQIRGESVTTSTDIYSLGILLFELLAGRPPWVFRSTSLTDAEQIICNAPAPKPSAILRESTPSAPWRALAGDLDNIVLMALRKDPDRRYRSVDELSEDIRRFQTQLPVIAREDSFSYRSVKFLRRHGVGVALVSAAIIALLFGIVYANVQRRRAEVRLTQMLSLANQTLLDLHAQIERQPGSMETRLRITKSTLAYLAGLASEAGNNQEVRSTLAKAYLATGDVQGYPDDPNLGDSTGALSSYQAAEKLFSPKDHIPMARLFWHRGVVLFKMGQFAPGVASLKKGIAEADLSNSRESLIIQAGAYHSLAYALTPTDPEEALACSRHETDIFTTLTRRDPNDTEAENGLADAYASTASALLRRNRIEEALALYRKGLSRMELLAVKHPSDVMIHRDLMNSYLHVGDTLGNPARRNLGDRRGALPYYRKARAIAELQVGVDPSNRLAVADLLEVLWRIGAVMESPEEAPAALAILDSARDRAHEVDMGKEINTTQLRTVSTIEQFRGWRLLTLKRLPEAAAAFQHSFDLAQSMSKKDQTDPSAWTIMLRVRSGLCPTLASLGRRDEALRCAHQAVEDAGRLAANGPDRFSMATYVPRTQMWLGAVYESLARAEETPQRRREDWAAAAASYSKGAEAWQSLRGRADIARFKAEISDCAKKVADCSHRANSRV
jgi:eukaryotic-like serine/threonine-protein kinase